MHWYAEYPQIQVTTRRQTGRKENDGQMIGHTRFFRERIRELLWQPTADRILDAALRFNPVDWRRLRRLSFVARPAIIIENRVKAQLIQKAQP